MTEKELNDLLQWLREEIEDASHRQARESDPAARAFHEGTMRAYLALQVRLAPKPDEVARKAFASAAEYFEGLIRDIRSRAPNAATLPGLVAASGHLKDWAEGKA